MQQRQEFVTETAKGDDLLGQQINLAWLHDGFEPGPAQFQMVGVGRQSAPDVRNAVNFLGRLDVSKNSPHLGLHRVLFD
jgi:hypothetical protein